MASSTELRNRAKFPYYFQMLNTEEIMAYAYYAMFKRFKWRRVTLIVQDENLFRVVSQMQGSAVGWEGGRGEVFLNFLHNSSSKAEETYIFSLM